MKQSNLSCHVHFSSPLIGTCSSTFLIKQNKQMSCMSGLFSVSTTFSRLHPKRGIFTNGGNGAKMKSIPTHCYSLLMSAGWLKRRTKRNQYKIIIIIIIIVSIAFFLSILAPLLKFSFAFKGHVICRRAKLFGQQAVEGILWDETAVASIINV